MKKLTWLFMSLMLFLGMGTAFVQADETLPSPTLTPAAMSTLAAGAEITVTLPSDLNLDDYESGMVFFLYTTNEEVALETTVQTLYGLMNPGGAVSVPFEYSVCMDQGDGPEWMFPITFSPDAPDDNFSRFRSRLVAIVSSDEGDNLIYSEEDETIYMVGGDDPDTKPAMPTFNPATGAEIEAGSTVAISAETEDIWYCIDCEDADLTLSGYMDSKCEAYGTPIKLNKDATIKAVAVAGNYPNFVLSDVATATYTVTGGEDLFPKLTLSKEAFAIPVVGGAAVFSCTLDPQQYTHSSNKVGFVVRAENGADIVGLEYQKADGEWLAYSESALATLKNGANMAAVPTTANATSRTVDIAETTANYRLKLSEGAMTVPELVFSVIELSAYGGIPTTDQTVFATATVSVKAARPTFDPEEGKVEAGQEIACTLTEGIDAEAYGNMAFILYVENDDETPLETDAQTLMAIVQGGGASPMVDGDTEDPAEVPYKVGFYAYDEEEWMMPVAISEEADGLVKFRARLALVDVENAEMPVYYSEEFNTAYYTRITPPTFTPASGSTVDFGAELTIASEFEDAMILYTTDGTEPSDDNGQYYMSFRGAKITGTTIKAIAVVGEEVSEVATATYTINPIEAELALTPMLEDTVGKNVGTGFEYSIENWQNYPATVYYTVDGKTEPSKAAYEAQADKENGAIKMVKNEIDEWGYGVMDGDGHFIAVTFTEAVQFKAVGYITLAGQEVVTPMIDQKLQIKAEVAPAFSLDNYAKVAAGDELVIENPNVYPDMPVMPEYPEDPTDEAIEAWYEELEAYNEEMAAWQEAIAPIPATQLYFSFDGTKPTPNAYDAQEADYDLDKPYSTYHIFRTQEGKGITVFFGEDEQGFYANVPAIDENLYMGHEYDTIRLGADGKFSVQVFAVSATKEEESGEPMPLSARAAGGEVFMYGSDFVTAYYTMNEEYTVETPEFSVAAGEVEKGTKVEITCATEGARIYYTVDGTEPTEKSLENDAIVINEDMTIKAIAVKDGLVSEVATATYTVKPETANEDLELAGVSVYPNPSNGMFNLDLPVAATVEVFASNGVLTQRLTLSEGNTTLNINRSGIYFLRITGEGRTAIKRIIVR